MNREPVQVKDLMTKRVVTLDRNDSLDVADDVMEMGHIRHLPVLDAGKIVGVLSQRDLFRSALSFALGYGEKGRKTLLKTLHVKDLMNQPVVTIAPEASVVDAAKLMLKKKIGCLPVLERDKMVGLLTETDVLRHVAER